MSYLPLNLSWYLSLYFIVLVSVSTLSAGYGDKIAGVPNWHERTCIVLTNACRMAPVSYRETYVGEYAILQPQNYPPVNPVFSHTDLYLSSRAHSVDMATDCGMQHNSCDNTLWSTRIKSYYSVSSTLAENIGYGYSTPQRMVKAWLFDNGAADKSSGDGHRKNIMNSAYKDVGAGYVSAGSFWTQDFGGGNSVSYNQGPIPSGSHLFLETGKTTFMLNFFDQSGETPQRVSLILEDTAHHLTLAMGTASRGTYSTALTAGSTCRMYYFEAIDTDGILHRYPATGQLITFGEGSCAKDFHATAIGIMPPFQRGTGRRFAEYITVSPRGKLRVGLPPQQGTLDMVVVTGSGQEVHRFSQSVSAQKKAVSFNLPARFPAGLYVVTLRWNGYRYGHCRIIK